MSSINKKIYQGGGSHKHPMTHDYSNFKERNAYHRVTTTHCDVIWLAGKALKPVIKYS